MSHTFDLGQSHFHTAESPLQLRLTATGRFIWPISSSIKSSRHENIQATQLFATWVTEAPEIELRLHIEIDPDQVGILSRFISSLGEKICGSKALRQVWSDLGFTIVFKSCEPSESGNETIPKSNLIFGISKEIRSGSLGRIVNRRIPTVLRDSPSAHPPRKEKKMRYYNQLTLTYSVDNHTFWDSSWVQKFAILNILVMLAPPSPVAEIYISDDEISVGSKKNDSDNERDFMSFNNSLSHSPIYSSLNCDQYYDADFSSSLQIHCQLFDQGLRRLVMSPPSKVLSTKIAQNNHLMKMTDLAPAVFMPQYRQVRLSNQIAELGINS
ncbi:hypothetical protein N7450_007993 [Penicillium hetheringtonii]|uniref:Uncharacterized protein n=1 Tax=Penicillium hetheringtonii TaxID=911720 RepID=A0AAD6GQX3_9EURO|nr:hypothetical protein N7450_007993 [Penicillium hetheringtonii]